ARGTSTLIAAAQRGYVDIAQMALEFGAFVNQADVLQNTALHYATESTHYDVVSLLLDNGANPNQTNGQGETALIWSMRVGDIDIIQMLIDAGADTGSTDFTGRSIFDHARNSRNPRLIEDLRYMGIEE
ncbi:MAG: ankyrin repeat domain-containing protein, partial [Alphaproteobacteria bacterium]|nr:ankyrin repeat domain-containing protein [Alphaproteobacteria bacterium]